MCKKSTVKKIIQKKERNKVKVLLPFAVRDVAFV